MGPSGEGLTVGGENIIAGNLITALSVGASQQHFTGPESFYTSSDMSHSRV